MVKDVQLYLDEAHGLGVPAQIAETIGRLWEATARDQGAAPTSPRSSNPLKRRPA